MKISDILDAPVLSVAELAKKYKTTLAAVNTEIARGEKVEQEHTTDPKVARRIALAHLGERLDYYQQLSKIDEVQIDNVRGWGNVPDNQNVDYLGMKVIMRPSVFLKLATPLSRSDAQSADKIKQHLSQGGSIASPWLVISIPEAWDQSDFSEPAQVVGHEGRNRMISIQELEGDSPVETHLFFSGGLRARHITTDWVHHLNQGMYAQTSKSLVLGPLFQTVVQEDTTRTTKSGAPGTLKAKISRLYGGAVTCDKAERLKRRKSATAHDKSQANWYQNMNCGGASKLDEIFSEPSKHLSWKSYGTGENVSYHTEFQFLNNKVTVEMAPDVRQVGAKYVFNKRDLDLPADHKGYLAVFQVNGSSDVTGRLGNHAPKLFAQVVSVMRGFLETHEWDYVLFTGEEGSRDKLYRAISDRLAAQVGAQVLTHGSDFVIHKPQITEQGGVGLVVPGVNMPTDQHPDEIRRQAKKFRFKVNAQGVPPMTRSDGKY